MAIHRLIDHQFDDNTRDHEEEEYDDDDDDDDEEEEEEESADGTHTVSKRSAADRAGQRYRAGGKRRARTRAGNTRTQRSQQQDDEGDLVGKYGTYDQVCAGTSCQLLLTYM